MTKRIVFNPWSLDSDRFLLDKHFKGAGNHIYCVDSSHTEIFFTREDGKSGFVFVGMPYRCSDYIDRMQNLRDEYVKKGHRTSPESINSNDGIAGFFWIASRGRI